MVAKKTVAKSPKDWKPEDKLKIVLEAQNIPDNQLGAFLRTKGIHETHLQQWRARILDGLSDTPVPKKPARSSADVKKIKELEKELQRKEKALAEAAALLVLKKKVHAIWGDEDNDTAGRTDK